ncbi:OadG family protein [bacterium]
MQGLIFMVVGMTIVFLFLGILVVAMNIMAKIIKRFPGEETQPVDTTKSAALVNTDIAVVLASIHSYKNK